jgi:phage-related tail protein
MKSLIFFIVIVLSLQYSYDLETRFYEASLMHKFNGIFKDVNHTLLYNEIKEIMYKIIDNRGKKTPSTDENEYNFFMKLFFNIGDLTTKEIERFKEYTGFITIKTSKI